MTDSVVINPGDIVEVIIASTAPTVTVEIQPQPTWGSVLVAGPQGPPGPTYDGVAWWYGTQPPATIPGSKPGDFYLDTNSGIVYTLGDL